MKNGRIEHRPLTIPPSLAFGTSTPGKVGKAEAEKAFKKISAELLPMITTTLETQKRSDQWNSDGGQFIPYPVTWLNQRRWEDDPKALQCGHGQRKQPRPTTDQNKNEGILIFRPSRRARRRVLRFR